MADEEKGSLNAADVSLKEPVGDGGGKGKGKGARLARPSSLVGGGGVNTEHLQEYTIEAVTMDTASQTGRYIFLQIINKDGLAFYFNRDADPSTAKPVQELFDNSIMTPILDRATFNSSYNAYNAGGKRGHTIRDLEKLAVAMFWDKVKGKDRREEIVDIIFPRVKKLPILDEEEGRVIDVVYV